VQKVVAELDVMPKEVSVEVGLKFAFEAGAGFFAIAKAGTEADMKVSLTWEPRKGSGE
jgi:phosphoglucomutase